MLLQHKHFLWRDFWLSFMVDLSVHKRVNHLPKNDYFPMEDTTLFFVLFCSVMHRQVCFCVFVWNKKIKILVIYYGVSKNSNIFHVSRSLAQNIVQYIMAVFERALLHKWSQGRIKARGRKGRMYEKGVGEKGKVFGVRSFAFRRSFSEVQGGEEGVGTGSLEPNDLWGVGEAKGWNKGTVACGVGSYLSW